MSIFWLKRNVISNSKSLISFIRTFLIKILFCDFILDYGVETDQVENEIAERSSAPEIIQR